MTILYHNPRCSKSRQALELLEKSGVDFEIKLYLKEPLSASDIDRITSKTSSPLSELIRSADAKKDQILVDTTQDTSIITTLKKHPHLIQRPLLETETDVIIGRPLDRIQNSLDTLHGH